MRRGALPALILLLLSPTAAAENLSTLEVTAGEAPTPPPGGSGEFRLAVRYCYTTAPLAPTNVDATITSAPEWLSAQANPSRFRADTGGTRCGNKEVVVQFTVARGAPAFSPKPLVVHLAGAGEEVDATAVVQAAYASEVTVTKPPKAQAARGDEGAFTLEVAVGANEATKMEITGRDPQGFLTLLSYVSTVPGAGTGLDAKVTQRIPFRFTVSPSAAPGVRPFPLNITTMYSQSPGILGDAEQLTVDVEVLAGGGNPTPGPAVALLALGAASMAWLARRRAR